MTSHLEKRIEENAFLIDEDGQFPTREFDWMCQEQLMDIVLPNKELDFNLLKTNGLLQLLKQIGRANLAVGRIYEGHINALHLIHLFGNNEQKIFWYNKAKNNYLFGVWNTQTEQGVTINWQENGKYILNGTKTFCSGGNWIKQPLITGELMSPNKRGWQMCIIPSEKIAEIKIDNSFWKPIGMKASASFKMDFSGIEVEEKDLLGIPGDYYKQPVFSSGAIRFVAVQVGGAEAIFKAAHHTLKTLGRTTDAFQKARFAEMAWLLESANNWIEKAGNKLDVWQNDSSNNDKMIAYIGMARSAVEEICIKIMRLSEQSIGPRGLLRPNILERLHRDLTIYLKQPAPDATILEIGDFLFKQSTINECWQ